MKRKLVSLFERLAYWAGLDALFYFLNRRAKRVVAFHNVIPDDLLHDGDRSGICMRESEFRLAVREMKKRFRISTDFDDEASLTLTFDDGYLNQYATAARVLQEEGDLTGVIFVTGNLVGSRGFDRALVIDRILQWKNDVPLNLAERHFGRVFASRDQLWSECLLPLFSKDASALGARTLAELEAVYPSDSCLRARPDEYLRLRFDGITEAQIADLRKRGWKIGHHTYSHFPVSHLGDVAAERELTPTDPEMLKVPFAYPYGTTDFVCPRDEAIAARIGYCCAYSCCSDQGPTYTPFFKRRMMVSVESKYRLHFELSGFRHFLKCQRLLPQSAI